MTGDARNQSLILMSTLMVRGAPTTVPHRATDTVATGKYLVDAAIMTLTFSLQREHSSAASPVNDQV